MWRPNMTDRLPDGRCCPYHLDVDGAGLAYCYTHTDVYCERCPTGVEEHPSVACKTTPANATEPYQEITEALEQAGTTRHVDDKPPPVITMGPADNVTITLFFNQETLPQWQRLELTPSNDEPPLWNARLTGAGPGEELNPSPVPGSNTPTHHSLAQALSSIAEQLGQQQTQ